MDAQNKVQRLAVRSIIILLVCVLGFTGCASTPSYYHRWYGHPTPALLLYASQVKHAKQVCEKSKVNDSADRFYKFGVDRGLLLSWYRENVSTFSNDEANFSNRYAAAWATMNDAQQRDFCTAYQNDVEWSKDQWIISIVNVSTAFRKFFSPISQEHIESAQNAQLLTGALSLGLLIAGVSQTQQGNFSAAKQFNSSGTYLANAMGSTVDPRSLPCEQYVPFVEANININEYKFINYYSVVKCP